MATNLENKIGRIRRNVTNALTVIAEKGVDVPPGANSDDLEPLIKAIEAGGGGGNWWFQTYIPSDDIAPPIMRHEIGKLPSVAGMYCVDFDTSVTGTQYVRHVVMVNHNNGINHLTAFEYKISTSTATSRMVGSTGYKPNDSMNYPIYITEYAVRVQPGRTAAQPWYMQAGKTYVFFAGVAE